MILNPKSGKGKATRVMHEKVGPAFKDGGLEYEVLLTERVNHAREVMASEPYPTKRQIMDKNPEFPFSQKNKLFFQMERRCYCFWGRKLARGHQRHF